LSIRAIEVLRPTVARIRHHDRHLGEQLRRALSSIALNVAEGNRSPGGNRLARFSTAAGSTAESRAALRVAVAWGYVEASEIDAGEAILDRIAGCSTDSALGARSDHAIAAPQPTQGRFTSRVSPDDGGSHEGSHRRRVTPRYVALVVRERAAASSSAAAAPSPRPAHSAPTPVACEKPRLAIEKAHEERWRGVGLRELPALIQLIMQNELTLHAMPDQDTARVGLLREIGDAYAELSEEADREMEAATSDETRAARAQVERDARVAAIGYYTQIATEYGGGPSRRFSHDPPPMYGALDDVLYDLAYEYEQDGALERARIVERLAVDSGIASESRRRAYEERIRQIDRVTSRASCAR
jgi:four helix bundle protein